MNIATGAERSQKILKPPNLFDFATSELSQDAFFSWLISWADPRVADPDPNLRKVAILLLSRLFQAHNKPFPKIINSLRVDRQKKNIDILVTINEEYAVIIEDKTDTSEHSDQLKRYWDDTDSKYEKLGIYLKTGDQSSYAQVKKAKFRPFLRSEILDVLEVGIQLRVENEIFLDYHAHLKEYDEFVNSFWTRSPNDKEYPWIGFYKELKKHVNPSGWEFVNNAAGGFWGFYWFKEDGPPCGNLLQLQENLLCFKIYVEERELQRKFRTNWHKTIMDNRGTLQLTKPDRFGLGKSMTAAVLKNPLHYVNGVLDLKATLEVLRRAEQVLTQARRSLASESGPYH